MKRIFLAFALFSALATAQTTQPLLQPHQVFVNGAGSPCANCLLYSYQAGTTTPQATYTDSSGTTQNANPIVLGTDGGANIWMANAAYKFALIDPQGSPVWTVDNVTWPGGMPANGCSTSTGGKLQCSSVTASSVATSAKPVADVYAYGAKGDGTTDDLPAINLAIASLGSGGGTVRMCAGNFKITATIYIPNGVVLQGCSKSGFPYGTSTYKSVITPVFSNLNAWVIDTVSKLSGVQQAYNDFSSTTYSLTYQTGVEGLTINAPTQTSTPIFGGVRIVNSPHATVRDVNVNGSNIGIGLAVVNSWEVKVTNWHSLSNYYGCVLANNSNAVQFDGVCDAVWQPSVLSIPAGVTSAVFGANFATYLSNNGLDAAHGTSQKGFVIWNNANGGTVNVEAQNWPDAVFLGNFVYGWSFTQLYTEGNASAPGKNNYVYTGSYASAEVASVSTFNADYLIDSGYDDRLAIHANATFSLGNILKNVSQATYAGGDRTAITIYDLAGTPASYPARVNFLNGPSGLNTMPVVSVTDHSIANNLTANNGYLSPSTWRLNASSPSCWTSATTDASLGATCDTGISRSAAGTVSVGNGTAGDASGTLKAANVYVGSVPVVAVADVDVSIPSFAIPGNTCYGSALSTTPATFPMPGLTTAMAVTPHFVGNPYLTTGWGQNGGLTIAVWASAANTGSYIICNPTSGSITGGAPTMRMTAQ